MIELPPRTGNFLDDSKTWDELLSGLTEGEPKDAVAKIAINELAGDNKLLGCDRIYVRSSSAYAIPESREGRGAQQAIGLNEVALLGGLGMADYIILEEGGRLTWRIFDAQPIELHLVKPEKVDLVAQEHGLFMPSDRPSNIPLHLPVCDIEIALPAPTNMWEHIRAA